MADLQKRADLLKDHLLKKQKEALEKADSFIDDFLTSDKYDYLVKGEGDLDLREILPVKLLAESPLDGSVHAQDLFDLRDEIKLQVPAMDICAGVLLYKITEYAGLFTIPLMESLST